MVIRQPVNSVKPMAIEVVDQRGERRQDDRPARRAGNGREFVPSLYLCSDKRFHKLQPLNRMKAG